MKKVINLLFIVFSFSGFAQSVTVNTALTPAQLVQDILVGSCTQISNVVSSKNGKITGTNNLTSYGSFDNGQGVFPFHNGVVLTTGNVNSIPGPNNNRQSAGWSVSTLSDNGWTGDSDIAKLLGIAPTETHNATVLEFDFVPITNQLSFDYVMASEEYTQDFPCQFSDGFAFILSGPGIPTSNLYDVDSDPSTPDLPIDVGGMNIALIPGTNIPVSITNIHKNIATGLACNAKNEAYYDNVFSNNNATNFNGQTVKLTANATVQKGATYHIKLVIAEHTDGEYDSAVFLAANSFNTGINLGSDQDLCEGTSVALNADLGVHGATYTWLKDGVVIAGQINTILNINNGRPIDSGVYRIEATLPGGGGCIITDEVNIVFNEIPKPAIPIMSWLVCDDNNDGFFAFNLTQKNTEILNGQDPAIFTVQYYKDAALTQEILTTYTNSVAYTQETIFVKITNKNNPICAAITSFVINVFDSPIPALAANIPTISKCDDALDGDSTNGFVLFDLTSQSATILNGQSASKFDLTYYSDAGLLNVIANPAAFTNTIAGGQTIYVKMSNKLNPACAEITSFKIVVNPIPNIFPTSGIKLCDTNNDGFMSFDLSLIHANILNGQDATLFNFKYFTDAALTHEITSPYTNKTAYAPETIYVQINNKSNSICGASTSFVIQVFESPKPALATNIPNLSVCDDNLDGNDANGLATFNLTLQNTFILNGQQASKFDITFFTDAAMLNAIATPAAFNNTVANEQTIYVSVVNKLNPVCNATTSFKVVVNPIPHIFPTNDIKLCDTNNDGFMSFDLTLKNASILNGQDATLFDFKYFTDAALTQEITSPYTNKTAYAPETIYVQINNKSNSICGASTSFVIQVFESPKPALATNIPNLSVCDDNLDGNDANGLATFNLTLQNTFILNGQQASKFDITFFTDAAMLNAIATPAAFNNTVANEQTIYVSVVNKLNPVCNATTSFKVVVNPLPIIDNVITLIQCDVNNDGQSDFNLSESDMLISSQMPAPTYSYYLNKNDAAQGNIANAITNTMAFSNNTASTVYARVENAFGCYRIATINLVVSAATIPLNFSVPVVACDADGVNDGIADFDLSNATITILNFYGSGQNLSVKYYQNTTDALAEANAIDPLNYRNTSSPFSQDVIARVENTDTNACVDIGAIVKLTINPAPQFNLDSNRFVCLNDLPLTVSIQNPLDTYTYVWHDEAGAIVGNSVTLQVSKGGIYSVTATNNLGCSTTKSMTITESVTATIVNIDIVDDSSNNTIAVNITGNGNYEIALDNLNSFVNFVPLSSLLGRTHLFTHVKGGIHTVYIRDKNGCGLTIQQAIVIDFPKFLTPNGDGMNDTWNVAGASLQPNSLVYIYDRFGKLIAKVNPAGIGWDGTLNGRELPSNDYWFTAILTDGHYRKGHFSLIRR